MPRYILKQNGSAPKSLNYMAHFDDNSDLLFHLKELKKGWNEQEYGKFDCDVMEIVEGLEVAASAFFNGVEFLKNGDGKVVGYLNFEEKKEADGGTGETTGEMGTTFISVTEDDKLFKSIMIHPKIVEVLTSIKFRGVFDINCIKTDKGIVGLEPTMRFGIPATSYEFIEGLKTPIGELLTTVAAGRNNSIDLHPGVGMVMCIVAKPYPLEADVDDEATSLGERLWILRDGKPVDEMDKEQKKHIHLENFERTTDPETGQKCYKVATKNGYLLTVTGIGKDISSVRESLIEYIKDNIYISGMKYRSDIGERVEDHMGISKNMSRKKEIESLKNKHEEEVKAIKQSLKEAIYGDD